MNIKFRTYCGLAGDLQELLIGETDDGYSESKLIPRTGMAWYRLWRMRRAKRWIINRIELITGRQYHETIQTPNPRND
jgi:hypothetical protein